MEVEKNMEEDDSKVSVQFYLNREEIEDQVVCALVQSIAKGKVKQGYVDEDGDWHPLEVKSSNSTFENELRNRVSKMLDEKLAEVLNDSLKSQLQEIVKARIEEIAASGLPEFDRYGEMTFTPWSKAISLALHSLTKLPKGSSSYNNEPKLVSIAREAFKENIVKVLKEEGENVKVAVRAAVDEQLSGTVLKTLREAIGLR